MSKEKLIEEVIKTFYKEMVIVKGGSRDSIGDPIPPYDELISQDPETYVDFIRLSLNKAINQTREETIRDVEEVLPEENYGDEDNCSTEYKNGWNDCREKIINKLKK